MVKFAWCGRNPEFLPAGCDMDKRTVIYYSDELNDEFSTAEITPRPIDENYVYIHTSRFKRFTHFFWYRIVATPIAFAYVKLVFGHRVKGRQKFRKHRKDGYFTFGNHTQDIADPFIPNMINFPKTNYVVVHANNVSMPVLGYFGTMVVEVYQEFALMSAMIAILLI